MRIIDTHCHLEQPEFENDLQDIINRAADAGIHIITSAISKADWQRAVEISKQYENVDVALGVDPILYDDFDSVPEALRRWCSSLVAIGEVGLDYYRERDHALRNKQETVFRNAIEFAIEEKLPVQVHSRSAGKRALEVLEDSGISEVHMHAFDGKSSLARAASNDLGYYFSIPPSVVRSPQKQKLVKVINIERIIVETDSPVLGPEGGERNEPLNVIVAIGEIAQILHRSEDEIREIALENTLRLYKRIVVK